jgi:hypothetical protein
MGSAAAEPGTTAPTSATAGPLGAPRVEARTGAPGLGPAGTGGRGATVGVGSGAGRPAPADMSSMRELTLTYSRASRLDSEGGVVAAEVVLVDGSSFSGVGCVGIIRECRPCNSESAGAFRRKSDDLPEMESWRVEARRRGLKYCSRRSLGWVADCLHG